MLKNVVLLVGLSGAGKSYCAHKSCESFWDTRRFAGDEVCRNVLSMFNVERFSLGNTEKWQKINKLGNIQLAQYWLFSLLLQQVHVENAISDGYRYFLRKIAIVWKRH